MVSAISPISFLGMIASPWFCAVSDTHQLVQFAKAFEEDTDLLLHILFGVSVFTLTDDHLIDHGV